MEEDAEQVPDTTSLNVQSRRTATLGRNFYTAEEDRAIRQYVEQYQQFIDEYGRPCSLSGNKIWQQMESQKVTNRTWMSMRDRYLRHIRQNPASPRSESEPDSSGFIHTLTKMRNSIRSKYIEPTPDDENSPSSSTHGYNIPLTPPKRRHEPDDDYSADNTSPSSPHLVVPKRAGSASVIGHCIAISDSEESDDDCASRFSNDDDNLMSQFDENILKFAQRECEIGDKTEEETEEETKDEIVVEAKDEAVSETKHKTDDETENDKTQHETGDEIEDKTEDGSKDQTNDMKLVIENLSPEQLSVLESVQHLRCHQSATLAQIFYSLHSTNGSLEDAMHYFEHGNAEKFWTDEDDQILRGNDEEAITQLAETRGIEEVEKRIFFLGNSSDSEDDS